MKTNNNIVDIHNFRGRRSGANAFFDLHLTLPADTDFYEVHEIIENVENNLKARFKGDSVIHADPDNLPLTGGEKIFATRRQFEQHIRET